MSTCITFSMEVEPLVFTTPLSWAVWPAWLPWASEPLASFALPLFPPQPVSMDRAMAAARARLNNFFIVILLTVGRLSAARVFFGFHLTAHSISAHCKMQNQRNVKPL